MKNPLLKDWEFPILLVLEYVKEVAKSLFANATLSEIDSNGNIVNLGDGKVKAIADRCVKYARMLLKSLNS